MTTKTIRIHMEAECTFEHCDVQPKDFALALAIAATDPRVQGFRIKPGDFVDVPVQGNDHLDNKPAVIRVHLSSERIAKPAPVMPRANFTWGD